MGAEKEKITKQLKLQEFLHKGHNFSRTTVTLPPATAGLTARVEELERALGGETARAG